jgi:peptide deformylase
MKIITLPNPILKKKCEPVADVNNEIKKLMKDMLSTMYKAPGIGLAAPQVGVSKRIIVMDVAPRPNLKRYQKEKDDKKTKYKPNPLLMINPEITWLSEEKETGQEGCLSIPGVMADITRPKECVVKYTDKNNKQQKLKAKGLLARCVQHEYDHIEGILFIDHLSKIKKDIILRKLQKKQKEKEQTT